MSDIALMDMGITQIAGDTDQRGIKPLSPFYQKNVIIAFISSIFEEVQTEIWKVNCRGIISKVYIKELFLEKIRYFLKLKYFSQVYIPRTEYMDINLRSQEIPIISDSVEKNYFIVKIGRNWRAKFTIS
ncbi:MAG: hypothetical protein HC903_27825 [Methylacidiphilales bacterium]|nr:hypothetical protein [Candidatus Methylacidiphilales bacterium]NJR19597.1 hypothetical protein [Calothrix sp. CSU_2_0]